jgi:hypothetical protein
MKSIKPGRGPSAMGVVGSIVGVVFGVFWTIMATFISSGMPQPIKTIFPLFGVLFIVIGIANVIYGIYNTTSKNRFSVLDITSSNEETDPLNEIFGSKHQNSDSQESIESKLQELDSIRSKGLISDAEYSSQRQRILNSI